MNDFVLIFIKMSQEMCRLCLSEDELKPIFPDIEESEKLTTVLKTLTGLKIQVNDGLPQQICKECTETINNFLKFRNQSHISEIQLLKQGFKRIESQIKEENVNLTDSLEDLADYEGFNKLFKIEVELDRITQDDDDEVISDQDPKELEPDNVQPKKKSREEMRQVYLSFVEGEFVPNVFPLICKVCKKLFNQWTSFVNHVRRHIRRDVRCEDVTQDIKNEALEAEVKTVKKSRKEMRQLYMNLVEGELDPNGPVKCKICKKTLNKWNSFINHARKHLGFKIVCEFCGKSFVSSNQLKRHCRSFHGMQRELKCEHCNYFALDMPQLKVHERREHTGERPFVCDLCAAAYFSRKCLLQHIESHRTTASVQCDKCPLTFKSRRHLAKHMYGTHSDKRRERRRERRVANKNVT